METLKEIAPDMVEENPELTEGFIYGIIEDAELVSIAPAPYIISRPQVSFAMLKNVWTKEALRGQGYATGTVRSMLNFLFTRKAIKSVYCWVEENNEPAMNLFKGIGFQETTLTWMGTRGFVKDLR